MLESEPRSRGGRGKEEERMAEDAWRRVGVRAGNSRHLGR